MSDTRDTHRETIDLELRVARGADGREVPAIVVRGELDLDGVELMRTAADATLASVGTATIGLDLGDLAFIDSVGLREPLRLKRLAEQQGREMHVVARSALVRRMIILAGLETVLRLPAEPEAG